MDLQMFEHLYVITPALQSFKEFYTLIYYTSLKLMIRPIA